MAYSTNLDKASQNRQIPPNVEFVHKLPLTNLEIYKKYTDISFLNEKSFNPKDRKITGVYDGIYDISHIEQYKKLKILDMANCDTKVDNFEALLKLPELKLVIFSHVNLDYNKLYEVVSKIPAKIVILKWMLPIE